MGASRDRDHQFRADYNIADDEPHLLGPEPPPGAFTQRLNRRDAAQLVRDTREQQTPTTALTPEAERASTLETRDPGRQLTDDAHGWEP